MALHHEQHQQKNQRHQQQELKEPPIRQPESVLGSSVAPGGMSSCGT